MCDDVRGRPLLSYSAWRPLGYHNPEAERKARALADDGWAVTCAPGIGFLDPRPLEPPDAPPSRRPEAPRGPKAGGRRRGAPEHRRTQGIAKAHPEWRVRLIGQVQEGFDPAAIADPPQREHRDEYDPFSRQAHRAITDFYFVLSKHRDIRRGVASA